MRLHYEANQYCETPVFSFQIERLDGVYVLGCSNADNNPYAAPLGPLERGEGCIDFRIDHLDLQKLKHIAIILSKMQGSLNWIWKSWVLK